MSLSMACIAALAGAWAEDSSTGMAYAKVMRAVSQMKEGFILRGRVVNLDDLLENDVE
jgi:hypothetical protein